MIKRLKWNVLYGGGDGVESDGSLSSSSSEDDRTAEDVVARQVQANEVLQQLVERDPDLAETLKARMEALKSSSEEEQKPERHMDKNQRGQRSSKHLELGGLCEENDDSESEREVGAEREASNPEAVEGAQAVENDNAVEELREKDQEYKEYRECELCPGKRLLSDEQVKAHLSSKRHLRAEARFEKRLAREEFEKRHVEQKDAAMNGTTSDKPTKGTDVEELRVEEKDKAVADRKSQEQIRKEMRQKAKVKRKLKALKRRKWEKLQASKMKCTNGEKRGDISETKVDRDGTQNAVETNGDEKSKESKPPTRTSGVKKRQKERDIVLRGSASEKQNDGHSGKIDDGDKEISLGLAAPAKEGKEAATTYANHEAVNKASKRGRDDAQSSFAEIAKKKKMKKSKTKTAETAPR